MCRMISHKFSDVSEFDNILYVKSPERIIMADKYYGCNDKTLIFTKDNSLFIVKSETKELLEFNFTAKPQIGVIQYMFLSAVVFKCNGEFYIIDGTPNVIKFDDYNWYGLEALDQKDNDLYNLFRFHRNLNIVTDLVSSDIYLRFRKVIDFDPSEVPPMRIYNRYGKLIRFSHLTTGYYKVEEYDIKTNTMIINITNYKRLARFGDSVAKLYSKVTSCILN